MGGEKPKKSGESGEKVVKNFFSIIGWRPIEKFNVPCVKPKKHKREGTKGDRQTHGVDYLVCYECPLSTETQENIVVSVKYTKKYVANPKRVFKEHLKDLAETIECLKYSEYVSKSINVNIRQKRFTGVIIWLAYEDDEDKGVIELISDFRNNDKIPFETVFLVDNKRINFLIKTIEFSKRLYSNSEVEFFYPDTGQNINSLTGRNTSGQLLPVHYINASVLPLKIINNETGQESLLLSVIDNFEEDTVKRLIGLCQNLTQGWASKIILCFSDYHELEHKEIVNKAKDLFVDKKYTDKIIIKSLNLDYRSLEEEEN